MRDFFFSYCEKQTEKLRVEKLPWAGWEPAAKRALEVGIRSGGTGHDTLRLDEAHTCGSRPGYPAAPGVTFSPASAPGAGVVVHVLGARSAGLSSRAVGFTCPAPLGDGCS